jgi:hypothetical protein
MQKTLANVFPAFPISALIDSPHIRPPRSHAGSLDSWVKVDKGVQHLQPEELAKAKGMPKDWQPASRKKRTVWQTIVSLVTVVHLWTAAMDPLGLWMQSRRSPETRGQILHLITLPKAKSSYLLPLDGMTLQLILQSGSYRT